MRSKNAVVVMMVVSLLMLLTSSVHSQNQTVITIDSIGNVGWGNSVAIDSQGNPYISYYDRDAMSVKLAHCVDSACSSITIVTIDSTGPSGESSSLQLDYADVPTILYQTAAPNNVTQYRLARCDTKACQHPLINLLDSSTYEVYSSMIFDKVDLPVACYSDANSHIELVRCNDDTCTNRIVRDLGVGAGTSCAVDIDKNNLPVVAFEGDTLNFAIARCNDVLCSNPTIYQVLSHPFPSAEPDYISMVLDGNGLPFVTFGYANPAWFQPLWLLHCQDTLCHQFTSTNLGTQMVTRTSMVLDPQGYPAIVFAEPNSNLAITWDSLWLVRCHNIACSSPAFTKVTAAGDLPIWAQSSIAFSDSGSIAVSYYDYTNKDLKLYWTPTLSLSNVELQQHNYPDVNNWVPLSQTNGIRQTTEGNLVRIQATIENPTQTTQSVKVIFKETSTNTIIRIIPVTLKPKETKTFPADNDPNKGLWQWDTDTYAWDANSVPHPDREIHVSLTTTYGTELDSKNIPVKVLPKPVILVHGIWSDASTWDNYKTYLQAVSPNWTGYAVGDGQAYGIIYTGLFPGDPLFISSIADNARAMNTYIDGLNGIRQKANAWHVDVVAHSMGGLISREYIQDYMGYAPDRKPAVSHLVMLGTPNAGSWCADLYSVPSTFELRPEIVALFNARVTNRKGVSFYSLAGNYSSSDLCPSFLSYVTLGIAKLLSGPNDGLVSVGSAFSIPSVSSKVVPDIHTNLTSQTNFNLFVKPILTSKTATLSTAADVGSPVLVSADSSASAVQSTNPQITASASYTLDPSATVDVPLSVSESSNLNVTVLTSETVDTSLLDPSGNTISSILGNSPQTYTPYRTHMVTNPVMGSWTLRLHNPSATDTYYATYSAWIKTSLITLVPTVSSPDTSGEVQLRATFTNNNLPITGATVTASLVREDGLTIPATLLDDGSNGDGAPGDGVYGSLSSPLDPGSYIATIQANGSGFARVSTIPFDVTSADLSVTQEVSPNPAFLGSPLNFILTISNSGPTYATQILLKDTLPPNTTLVAISTDRGTCTNSALIVTCSLDSIASGTSAIVNVTANVGLNAASPLTNQAQVSAKEPDSVTDNNLSTVDVPMTLQPISIISPADQSTISDLFPKLTWSSSPGATGYELKLDTQNSLPAPAMSLITNNYTSSSPLLPMTYFWQVRAIRNGDLSSPWTTIAQFGVQSPDQVAPFLNYFTTATPALTWSPVTGALGYEVQVAHTPSFDSLDFTTEVQSNVLSVTTSTLSNGGYFWRVRAKLADGTPGSWSIPQSFEVNLS